MLPYEDRRRAVLWLRESLLKAEEAQVLFPSVASHIRSTLVLEWNDRMHRTMGTARYAKIKSCIELSTILWEVAPEDQKRETVYHEMAHIITDANRANDPITAKLTGDKQRHHGAKWRYVMHQIGYPNASRCHAITNEEYEKSQGKVQMYCACPNPPIRFFSAKKARRIYSCNTCHVVLSPTPRMPLNPNVELLNRLNEIMAEGIPNGRVSKVFSF